MNNFTPQRRGLGRGLGSLIPTGPLPPERSEPATAPGPDQPEATADWIGRVGAQRGGVDAGSDDRPQHTEPEHTEPEHTEGGHSQSEDQAAPAHDSGDGQVTDERPGPEQGEGAQPELRPVSGAYFAELP